MYKLLIVDDEQMMRDSLAVLVDWPKANIVPVGSVMNGCEALEFIENNHVDIVVTDIRMPRMDGLELACELQSRYPAVKTILYSAHNDFEFARKGIQYGVHGYLLKSQDEDEILSVFCALTGKMDDEAGFAQPGMQTEVTESRQQVKRRRFMKAFCNGELSEQDINLFANECKVDLYKKSAAVLFSIHEEPLLAAGTESLARQQIEKHLTERLLAEMVWNKDGCILGVEKDALCLWHTYYGFPENVERLRRELSESFNTAFPGRRLMVTAAVGPMGEGPAEICASIHIAREALSWRYHLGDDRLIAAFHMATGEKPPPDDQTEERMAAIQRAWAAGAFNDFLTEMSGLCINLKEREASCAEVESILECLLALWPAINREKAMAFIKESGTIDNAFSYILCELDAANLLADPMDGKRQKRLLEKALEYLHENYTKDIGLRNAAEYINIHPVYLSRLFRQEMDTTFKSVLTTMRIERAKELLDDIDLKVYEISDKVGYKKPRYFSVLFKEVTGMTPLGYRERRR